MAYHYDSYDRSLVIDGYENGIADSPYLGLSDVRNVDIGTVPGEASVGFSTAALSKPPIVTAVVFSVSAATDFVTVASTAGYYNGMAITLNTLVGGTGLTALRVYWIGNLTGNTFKLYTTPGLFGATAINVTVDGTGTLSSYTPGQPKWWAVDGTQGSTQYSFFVDANGLVWWANNQITGVGVPSGVLSYLGNTTLTLATGNGLVCYHGYLIVFRFNTTDYIKVVNILNTGDAATSWVYGWESVSAGVNHQAYSATDNAVYWCDGSNGVGSFYENATGTFNPASSGTYTKNQPALSLPDGDQATFICELGTNLMVGGRMNRIYPWDRVSTSFRYPILIAENYVTRMVTVNTNTYIFAGVRGRIYITNGSQAQLYKKVPDHLSGTVNPYFLWGDASYNRNELLFGVRATDNAGTAINQYGALWAINLDTNAIYLKNELSYTTYAGFVTAMSPVFSATLPSRPAGYGMYLGWDDGASGFGVDQGSATPYTGGQAMVDSDLIPVGTFEKPRDFGHCEYRLSRPLVSGESISVQYRLIFDTGSTGYTTIFTDATTGAYSNTKPVNFKNAQWLQFRTILTSTASAPSYVRLTSIRFREIVASLPVPPIPKASLGNA